MQSERNITLQISLVVDGIEEKLTAQRSPFPRISTMRSRSVTGSPPFQPNQQEAIAWLGFDGYGNIKTTIPASSVGIAPWYKNIR